MSLTNTEQCMGVRNKTSSRKGSRNTQRGDRNGDCGNSSFANYSFVEKLEDSCISNLTITKSGPQSNQLKKTLDTLPDLY